MVLEFDPTLGYIGLFTVSFVGSVIPFIPVPFFVFLTIMSVDPAFDPHILALSTTIGATAGKLIIFYASYYGRRVLSKESKHKMLPLQKVIARYGWFASFIAAATPVPDDLVYIPLGLAKYNPIYFLLSTLGGKIVISEAVVWGSKLGLSDYIQPLLENEESALMLYVSTGILAVIIGVMIYYMTRIDWYKYMGKIFPWAVEDDEDDEKKE
ncbi:MAG: DedA family protein [Candidatus Nitrosothermus koennekii]|nr:MAG: DedA family protein [Candidatus Nitrosothermus koennekii]